jgi:hypothetical protein
VEQYLCALCYAHFGAAPSLASRLGPLRDSAAEIAAALYGEGDEALRPDQALQRAVPEVRLLPEWPPAPPGAEAEEEEEEGEAVAKPSGERPSSAARRIREERLAANAGATLQFAASRNDVDGFDLRLTRAEGAAMAHGRVVRVDATQPVEDVVKQVLLAVAGGGCVPPFADAGSALHCAAPPPPVALALPEALQEGVVEASEGVDAPGMRADRVEWLLSADASAAAAADSLAKASDGAGLLLEGRRVRRWSRWGQVRLSLPLLVLRGCASLC